MLTRKFHVGPKEGPVELLMSAHESVERWIFIHRPMMSLGPLDHHQEAN
jgi:hypothetical protein